jgi:thymidylate synthase ThyX
MISAQVICDSKNAEGNRLTTFQLRYPKFIHGEFMTHRVFSRNASSSRAIPTKKYLEEVRSDKLRAAPEGWGKNQKGMSASEELSGVELERIKDMWKSAALSAATQAEGMDSIGAHKQLVNRILEPFIHINVVCTATKYDNFFGLRLDENADPTMQALAKAMWDAYSQSTPRHLSTGEWHLPYITPDDWNSWKQLQMAQEHWTHEEYITRLIKMSVARCARVSYQSFETGKQSTLEEDLKLFDRLLANAPIHASPAEHQATPDDRVEHKFGQSVKWAMKHEHGNFTGWRQYRKMLKGEAIAPLPEKYLPF